MSAERALAYHRWRLFYFLSGLFLQVLALAVLIATGLSAGLFDIARGSTRPLGEISYFCLVFLYLSLVSLPLELASGYFLEKKFSLSTQSPADWWIDHLKKTLLSLTLFLLNAVCFFAAVRAWPRMWWLALALGWSFLCTVLAAVFPVLILPLFYRSRPLDDTAFKEELLGWCRSLGLPVMDIHEIDFSKKTVKANAALTGFGKTRRVLLGDTLLSGFTPDEIKMVLSHEIGHHVRGHLVKGVLLDLFSALAAFYALYIGASAVAAWAGVQSLGDPRVLPALSLLAVAAGSLWMPFRNTLSRRYEKEADRYAWKVFPSESIFTSVMNKLAEKNLSHRAPARWEEVMLASHPSIDRRIAAARVYFSRHP